MSGELGSGFVVLVFIGAAAVLALGYTLLGGALRRWRGSAADAVASAQERLRVGKLQGRHLQEGFDLFGHGGQHGL